MTKYDVPYVVLTLVFGLSIFVAGRMSAPTTSAAPTTAVSSLLPPAPSIFVIASTPEPPVALLPEVPAEPSATLSPTSTKKPVTQAVSTDKATEPSPVKSEAIFLEETPDLPANPYKLK